jgi:hypothetical protein
MAKRTPDLVAQLGSASALGAKGRRFESCHPEVFKIQDEVIAEGFTLLGR